MEIINKDTIIEVGDIIVYNDGFIDIIHYVFNTIEKDYSHKTNVKCYGNCCRPQISDWRRLDMIGLKLIKRK